MYNLTESQKNALKWLVEQARSSNLTEEFTFVWQVGRLRTIRGLKIQDILDISKGTLDVFADNNLVVSEPNIEHNVKMGKSYEKSRRCTLTQKAYDAVDSNFGAPDTSFIKYLTPLADVSGFDNELKLKLRRAKKGKHISI